MTEVGLDSGSFALSEIDRSRMDAGLKAGLFAGLFMLTAETVAAWFFGQSLWLPFYMVSAVVQGPDILASLDTFSVTVVLSALAVYFPLSIVYAVAFANIACLLAPRFVIIAGALYGLSLYVINFYVLTELWYWLQITRGEANIAVHILYGVVVASSYRERAIVVS